MPAASEVCLTILEVCSTKLVVLYDHLLGICWPVSEVLSKKSHLVCINTKGLSLHVALKIITGHTDGELNVPVNVHHTAVGMILGVDLPAQDLVGGDGGHHVRGSAADGDVVTGAEVEGASHFADDEEGVLNLGQGCGCVVGEPWTEALTIIFFLKLLHLHLHLHLISSVGVIYRSDNDKAEVSSCLHGGNVLDRGLALGIDVLDTAKKGGCKASNTFHVCIIL